MNRPAANSGDVFTPEILESPEEVLTTLTREGKRRWMYPVPTAGRFAGQRRIVAWFLIVLYVALPLISIGGHPAVLLDFIHRQFAFFGLVFYPTDTVLLMFVLIGSLLGVVLVTSLLGRVWCGWACPQTVYLEFLFRPIERLLEGPERKRKRRDESPMSVDKFWRKTVKLGIYLVISLGLAHTFVAYFAGWSSLLFWMQRPPAQHWGFFVFMALTTGLVLFDFSNFREQMCTIACPYARMQSVLLDPDSLIVSYDRNRGEPRSKRSKKKPAEEEAGLSPSLGDCIDCAACVRTCPTGIDIRDGLQMECIACTQCIDACDAIMDRIAKPRGLIRYTSENALAGSRSRALRARTLAYGILLAGILSAFSVVLSTRSSYDINVGRVVGEPFSVLPDGRIANRLRFRVRNQTSDLIEFSIESTSPENVEIRLVGLEPVALEPGEMKRIEAWILVPPVTFKGDQVEGHFSLSFSDGVTESVRFMLLGPSR